MTPTQMTLDFTASEMHEEVPPRGSAQVVDLRCARAVKQRETLAPVYKRIYDSVSHIQIRKTSLQGEGESSASQF